MVIQSDDEQTEWLINPIYPWRTNELPVSTYPSFRFAPDPWCPFGAPS